MINPPISYDFFNDLSAFQVGIGIVAGFALHALIPRIVRLAIRVFNRIKDVFQNLGRAILNTDFVVNIRSVGCKECADEHRNHFKHIHPAIPAP